MLRAVGCDADSATDAAGAGALYRQAKANNRRFDTVILDLTMASGMSGLETLAALREIDPHINAIVSSGYSDDPVVTRFADYGFSAALPVPYFIRELGEVLSSVSSARYAGKRKVPAGGPVA